MAVNYNTIRKQEKDRLTNSFNEADKTMKGITQQDILNYGDTIQKQQDYVNSEYQNEIDSLPGKYASLYDENDINERVARKRLQEQMANAGLTNSGLNRSQSTALTVARQNADSALYKQQQEQANELRRAQMASMVEAEANKANYANQRNTAYSQWRADQLMGIDAAATEAATNQYNAFINAAAKQASANQAALKADRDYQLQLAKAGFTVDKDGTLVKSTAVDEDPYKEDRDALILSLAKSGGQAQIPVEEILEYAYQLYPAPSNGEQTNPKVGTVATSRRGSEDIVADAVLVYGSGGAEALAEYINGLGLPDDDAKWLANYAVQQYGIVKQQSEKPSQTKTTTKGTASRSVRIGSVDLKKPFTLLPQPIVTNGSAESQYGSKPSGGSAESQTSRKW